MLQEMLQNQELLQGDYGGKGMVKLYQDAIVILDAIVKRVIVLPMRVSASRLPETRVRDDPVPRIDFVVACVYARLRTPHDTHQ
jgi:hypothetical protein